MAKLRQGDRDVRVAMAQGVDWSGRTPVLLDDIISTGHTLMAAAQALQQAGLRAPVCVGVHALCDEAAVAGLRAAGVQRVVSCDTVPHASNAISVVPLLARAIADAAKR
jgi:ribose-phosphate pyrophosphokinase